MNKNVLLKAHTVVLKTMSELADTIRFIQTKYQEIAASSDLKAAIHTQTTEHAPAGGGVMWFHYESPVAPLVWTFVPRNNWSHLMTQVPGSQIAIDKYNATTHAMIYVSVKHAGGVETYGQLICVKMSNFAA